MTWRFMRGSGRLELARAIASRENPLTARVMVNRLWLHHFGAGLVTTPDQSFGGRPANLLKRGTAGPQPYSNRRTVYGSIDRNDLLALLRIFDVANPDLSMAQRDATTVPQQALFFLNSPFVMEQARALVKRPAFQRLDDDTKRVRSLYQRVYQRDPKAKEIRLGLRFLQEPASTGARQPAPRQPLTPQERYAQVLLMSNELLFVD